MAGSDMKINPRDLPPDVAKVVSNFCDMLIWVHAHNLESIAVYGSALSINYIPNVSNINILCVFSHISVETLRLSLQAVKFGHKHHIVAPLFLTLEYVKSSLDTFPIEFLEIIEHHRTVYGKELLSTLTVSEANLRLQCEQQIKSQIVRLQQAYLEHGKNKKILRKITMDSFGNLFPIFRTMLRLENIPIPESYEEIILKMSTAYHFDGQIFVDILRDKMKFEKILWKEIDRIYGDILAHLEVLANKIDQLKLKGTS